MEPTHYKVTVKRPVEVMNIQFNPGGSFEVKKKVYDALVAKDEGAILKADPFVKE